MEKGPEQAADERTDDDEKKPVDGIILAGNGHHTAEQHRRLDHMVARTPDHAHAVIQNQQQGKGEQQLKGNIARVDFPQQKAFDQDPQCRHPQGAHQQAEPERVEQLHGLHAQVGAEHEQRAVGEIEDSHHPEDGGQANRDQKQQHPPTQSVQGI